MTNKPIKSTVVRANQHQTSNKTQQLNFIFKL